MAAVASDIRSRVAVGGVILLFVALATAALRARGALVERFFHDFYVLADYAWRAELGQTPHLDYHTPIGQAFTWPFRLLSAIEPATPLMIVHAGSVVGALVLLLSLACLPARMSPVPLFATAATTVSVAMSPRDLDALFYVYSHNAPYNRWGFALLILLAATALVPRQSRAGHSAILTDGAGIGLILGLLLYLKVNFLVGGIGFVVLGATLRQLDFRTLPVAGAALASLIVVVELTTGNNAAYLADLHAASAVNGRGALARLWSRDLMQTAVIGAFFVVASAAALSLLRPSGSVAGFVRTWWKELLIVAAMAAIATVIHTQNNFTREMPIFSASLLILVELQRRRSVEAERASGPRRAAGWAAIALLAGMTPALDALSVLTHSAATRGSDARTIPALRGTAGETLLVSQALMRDFPDRPALRTERGEALLPPNSLSERRRRWRALTAMEVRGLDEAMSMLRSRVRPGDVVFAAHFANPFPAFLRLPPPPGSLPWWHLDRSYSATRHPDLRRIFDDTDWVIHKRVDTFSGPHGQALWPVIRPSVEARFRPVVQGHVWTLWSARARAGG